ncbi:MAG: hypothetical protein JW940_09195 [Polyangiaceae bacterium]|nr:hypothetical protein [Polyangiaceae bacterium]
MPDASDHTISPPSSRARTLWWTAAALGVAALVAGTVCVVRWHSAKSDAMLICQSLEKTGAVARCTLQRSPIVYGVQAEQVVRFDVKYEGHRAYLGTLARVRDQERIRQLLRLASEADRRSARKTAAAAEIGSGGRVSGASIMAALAPIQIANLGRCIVADLKPVYGGPQQAAAQQVEAIRARIMQ